MDSMADVRRERLGQLTSLPPGRGLEIGPLAEPILLRAERDVRYVDVLDQAGLREHYRDDPAVDCAAIPPIDYTLTTESGGVVTLAEAVKDGGPYAYVVACHVVEHVPDLVGWLADVATVLGEDGLLLLVVPDRRYSFDLYRQQTSVGQLLQAAQARDLVPSVRAVYDHFRDAVSVSAAEVWDGVAPRELASSRLHSLRGTLTQVERARAGHYVDCHVWTFTPEVFVEQVSELAVLGLCDFTVEALTPTPRHSLEFYAVLRRIDPAADAAARRALVERSRQRARAALDSAPQPPDPAEVAEQEHRRQREELSVQLEALSADLAHVTTELGHVTTELEQVKRSERWKVGGALVAPLSQARRRWRQAAGRLRARNER